MQRVLPEAYNFVPRSFIVPGNYQEFRSYIERENAGKRKEERTTYLVKPDKGSLGRGIFIIQEAESLSTYQELAIVQRYVSPFLVDKLKFDLRIYALITSADPLRLYIHDEGMARFCTEPYVDPSPRNLENPFCHLTNYSLNKNNQNFNNNSETGHKRPMSSIFAEVKARGFDVESLKLRIDEIVRLTIASIQPFLANNYRSLVSINDGKSRCFELLGFDIMIDKKARPWLLEVNSMPMLDIDTAFDRELKFAVITGIFKILGLTPGFRQAVLRRNKAETELRINGSTCLPIERIFDPELESKTAAESTNWRQLYPLVGDVVSNIDRALAFAKRSSVGSMDNVASRARHKVVLSQIQDVRGSETKSKIVQVKLKSPRGIILTPPIQIITKAVSMGTNSLPLTETETRVKATAVAPIPVSEAVSDERPVLDLGPVRLKLDVMSSIALWGDAQPVLLNRFEEEERLRALGSRESAIRLMEIPRIIGECFNGKGASACCVKMGESLLKLKAGYVKKPNVMSRRV
jgi:tubulin polyglutamylase TTLL6/13